MMALLAQSIACVTMESSQQSIYNHVKETLWEIARRGFNTTVRAAAIMTLGIACFVHSNEDSDTNDVLKILHPILSGKT